jgi:hypothetical protein
MTEHERHANEFIGMARAQWEQLVKTARGTHPRDRIQAARTLAYAAGVGKSTLQRKLEAIHAAMKEGYSDEKLIEMGQRAVMAKFVIDKRSGRQDEQVCLKWMVAPELRDGAHEAFYRIGKLLGMTTSNEVWSFLLAQMTVWTDEEILHAAGEGHRAQKRSQ